MNTQWKVRIDLPRLQANLSEANRWPFTPDDTFRWLAIMGFRQDGGYWFTDAPHLERLEPEEILDQSQVGACESSIGPSAN